MPTSITNAAIKCIINIDDNSILGVFGCILEVFIISVARGLCSGLPTGSLWNGWHSSSADACVLYFLPRFPSSRVFQREGGREGGEGFLLFQTGDISSAVGFVVPYSSSLDYPRV